MKAEPACAPPHDWGSESGGVVFRGLVPFTMVDFPGRLAVTVYTMGCNFRCPICHNRELALSLGEGLPEYDVDAVLDVVRSRGGWIEGVCVTGGEPLIQKGLAGALARFKDEGLAVKLDTNGSFPDHLEEILKVGLVDYVAMDMKAPLMEDEYSRSAGVPMEKWLPRVEASVEAIKRSGIDHEFRTICLPGLHSPEAVVDIARENAGPGVREGGVAHARRDARAPRRRAGARPRGGRGLTRGKGACEHGDRLRRGRDGRGTGGPDGRHLPRPSGA